MNKTLVALDRAFVLHTWPHSETSLIADCFTFTHGRIAMVAKGAKRPYSPFRGLLQAMLPLRLSWSGRNEIKTLCQAELAGAYCSPVGMGWLCGCYVNELIIKLLGRNDPHPELFEHYNDLMLTFAQQSPDIEPVFFEVLLRGFEKKLLRHIGYDVSFGVDSDTGLPLESSQLYCFKLGQGIVKAERASQEGPVISGHTLLAIEKNEYQSSESRAQAKALMRFLINHHLGGEVLRTRKMLLDLQNLSNCL